MNALAPANGSPHSARLSYYTQHSVPSHAQVLPHSARLRLAQESSPMVEQIAQPPCMRASSRVFAGSQKHMDYGRCGGAIAKDRLVAARTGRTLLPEAFQDAGKSILAGTPRTKGKRCYPNTPLMQSIVDQVVFGRDMDISGEEQQDDEFTCMYQGGAGLSSQELARMALQQGIRPFPNVPTMQSVVDQVVFGRDMDYSGEEQFDEEYQCMYRGAAGRPAIGPLTVDKL